MKILWVSNAPWQPSGYGSQTRQVGRRIAASGTEIEFAANDGTRGDSRWEGLLVRGAGADRYSRDTLREDLTRSGADWAISLYDGWVYTEGVKDPFEGLPHVASWTPVDHHPVPMSLYGWLGSGHTTIAMSRFGEEWLRKLSDAWRGADHPSFPVRYAPHAVEDTFAPTDSDFRQRIGVPTDAFLIGIVASNVGSGVYDRKGMSDMAAALGIFMDDHPDAYVYVHTITDGVGMIQLPIMFAFNGVPEERLRWADQHRMKKLDIGDAEMAEAYSAFDVLLATSRGEGFGIPVIEAQACGTPVIASNWTAQTELVSGVPWSASNMGSIRSESGWLVACIPDYDAKQPANWGKPFHGQIVAALREAHEHKGEPALRDAAIARAADYRADTVFETHWKPILAEMEDALHPNREVRRAKEKAARKAAKVGAR